MNVAIDRNVWQYLVEASCGAYDPASDGTPLRAERVAALQIVLYSPMPVWIAPSVHGEFDRIEDPLVSRSNSGLRDVFLEVQARALDPFTVALRITALLTHHKDRDDCRAVAEAEVALMSRLLTFDDRLIRRLAPHTGIALTPPSAHWRDLAIPRGAAPCCVPADTNPLSTQSWWRW